MSLSRTIWQTPMKTRPGSELLLRRMSTSVGKVSDTRSKGKRPRLAAGMGSSFWALSPPESAVPGIFHLVSYLEFFRYSLSDSLFPRV